MITRTVPEVLVNATPTPSGDIANHNQLTEIQALHLDYTTAAKFMGSAFYTAM
jgi:hypothetical protein